MQRFLTCLLFLAFVNHAADQPVWGAGPQSATDAIAPKPNAELLEKGKQLYQSACAQCHGREGQGSEDHYSDPLIGDLTIGELTEVISDTMPEEDPDACVAEDAFSVATYIHQAFYGTAAQVRNRPPQIQLMRLTAEQLRQSYADLFAHFSGSPWTQDDRGVEAIYYDGTRRKKENKKIERVDAVIDFDFQHQGPGDGIRPTEFAVTWNGSIKVDQTGKYEIILRSSCSCILRFGDNERTLVNNHVQSEGKEEFRRTMYLTGGRAYPFQLDFIQRKRKTEQPPAKVSLSWIPPQGTEEIIPQRNLIPNRFPSAFALQAKLPADDRSYGYERGTAINRQWDDSTTESAIEFAQIAIDELYPRYRRRHRDQPDEERSKLRGFLAEMLETAFRGPLDPAIRELYINRQVDQEEDDAEAIKRVLLMALKSPRFLYPTLDDAGSPSRKAANQLALVMHDSLPSDQWLHEMIEKDQLQSTAQIEKAAWKMIRDYRTQAKVRAFLYQWLDLSDLEMIGKDSDAYPEFDETLVVELKKSFDAFLDHVVQSDGSDFRQLLQADWAFTNETLESFYGEAWKVTDKITGDHSDDGRHLAPSVRDAEKHVGVLTHPLLTSHLAYHANSSPIHRGVFLTRHVLGRVLRPPDGAFSPLSPELHPNLTTRQRVQLQTGDTNCQVCHAKINSLGFALENFDAVGRYRHSENDQPIDASGGYTNRNGDRITFEGARELGDFLANSSDCHQAFVDSAFEHFVKQSIAAYGPDTSERLTQSFQQSGFNVQQLIVSIAVIVAEHAKDNPPITDSPAS